MMTKIKTLLAQIKSPWHYLGRALMFPISVIYWFIYGIVGLIKMIIKAFKKKGA